MAYNRCETGNNRSGGISEKWRLGLPLGLLLGLLFLSVKIDSKSVFRVTFWLINALERYM